MKTCPGGVDCTTPCVTLAGTGVGGNIHDLTGADSINFNQNGCDQSIACSNQQFYANNPRVCYNYCKKNPGACSIGPNACAATNADATSIIGKILNSIFGGKQPLQQPGCDYWCQDNPAACQLNTVCPQLLSSPDAYNAYKATGNVACTTYCNSATGDNCGFKALCDNSANYDDPRCIDYCMATHNCDGKLAAYCNDPNNIYSKPICSNYYCSVVNPSGCQQAKMNYCMNNITDPKCRDFCKNGCSVTTSTGGGGSLTTGCNITSQCDNAAITYCAAVAARMKKNGIDCSDPTVRATLSGQDLSDCNFCSCINSQLSTFGSPVCLDAYCQQSAGYTTNSMNLMLSSGNCPSCMQIVNGGGSYFSINGITQQMTCNGAKPVGLVSVPAPMALVGKYSSKWMVINQGSGGGAVSNNVPTFNARMNAFISELPPTFSVLTQADIQKIWVQIFNAMGELNYDDKGVLQDFTPSQAQALYTLSLSNTSSNPYQYAYQNLSSQYSTPGPSNTTSPFYIGVGTSLSSRGMNVAQIMGSILASQIAAAASALAAKASQSAAIASAIVNASTPASGQTTNQPSSQTTPTAGQSSNQTSQSNQSSQSNQPTSQPSLSTAAQNLTSAVNSGAVKTPDVQPAGNQVGYTLVNPQPQLAPPGSFVQPTISISQAPGSAPPTQSVNPPTQSSNQPSNQSTPPITPQNQNAFPSTPQDTSVKPKMTTNMIIFIIFFVVIAFAMIMMFMKRGGNDFAGII